jgi:hypothetical protein
VDSSTEDGYSALSNVESIEVGAHPWIRKTKRRIRMSILFIISSD